MALARALLAALLALLLCGATADNVAQNIQMRLTKHTRKQVARQSLLAFIGVQTSFGYRWRRSILRGTWFPKDAKALNALKADKGIMLRFVIGYSTDANEMHELNQEAADHGGFLRLAVQEQYSSLTLKTYLFLKAVLMRYDPQYVFKADDDVYIQIDRIPLIVPQWAELKKDYIGCFLRSTPVIQPGGQHPPEYERWIEPQGSLLSTHYPTYARGSLYVLSRGTLRWLLRLPDGSVRFYRSEDVSVGMWMAALNATHYEDFRLCSNTCSDSAIAFYNVSCNGLCDLNNMNRMAEDPRCSGPPALDERGWLPLWRPNVRFTQLDKFGSEVPSSTDGASAAAAGVTELDPWAAQLPRELDEQQQDDDNNDGENDGDDGGARDDNGDGAQQDNGNGDDGGQDQAEDPHTYAKEDGQEGEAEQQQEQGQQEQQSGADGGADGSDNNSNDGGDGFDHRDDEDSDGMDGYGGDGDDEGEAQQQQQSKDGHDSDSADSGSNGDGSNGSGDGGTGEGEQQQKEGGDGSDGQQQQQHVQHQEDS